MQLRVYHVCLLAAAVLTCPRGGESQIFIEELVRSEVPSYPDAPREITEDIRSLVQLLENGKKTQPNADVIRNPAGGQKQKPVVQQSSPHPNRGSTFWNALRPPNGGSPFLIEEGVALEGSIENPCEVFGDCSTVQSTTRLTQLQQSPVDNDTLKLLVSLVRERLSNQNASIDITESTTYRECQTGVRSQPETCKDMLECLEEVGDEVALVGCLRNDGEVGVCCPVWTDYHRPQPPLVTRPPSSWPYSQPVRPSTTFRPPFSFTLVPALPVGSTSTPEPEGSNRFSSPPPLDSESGSPECGVHLKLFTRIVGGSIADPKEWPWMAALLNKASQQFCGAALIHRLYVLSASHCVVSTQSEDVIVRLGEYDFSKRNVSRELDIPVECIFTHPQYNRISQVNDIALLKLRHPVTFNSFIKPVCLPPPGLDFVGKSAVVTGWGTTSFQGQASDVLREVIVPVWNNEECTEALPLPLQDSQMCAGYKSGGRDSCQGDSGGPMVLKIEETSDVWFLAGIVSYGIKCASPGVPGVYTRVNKYLGWIQETIESNYEK